MGLAKKTEAIYQQPHIFLSHSQKDEVLLNRFLVTCGLAGIQGVAFEFDAQSGRAPLGLAVADVIKRAIVSAKALFVIIGPNVIASQYTSNWVSFEIGLAYACNPPVPLWVFEDLRQAVDFPVPAATHHCLFDPNSNNDWDYIRSVMETYSNIGLFSPRDPISDASQVCPYSNCEAVFQTHYPPNIQSWKCPSCRQTLHWVN